MKYVYEFIGTFFLVLTVGMTALEPHSVGLWAPLAIGSALAVMVYAGGHISGGHYNPAVSFAVFIRNRLTVNELCFYWIAQLFAGAVAALVTLYLKGEASPTMIDLNISKAFLAEFIFTFALCYVVLNVATAKETGGNSYFGWAIGTTVIVGAYAVGGISGGAFNPSVALGITLLQVVSWSNIWVYFVANLLGAAAASLVFKAAHQEKIIPES